MKLKLVIIIAICIVLVKNAFSQIDTVYLSPVKIGQTLPSYRITDIINYRDKEVNLRDSKNKILILDFWTLGCKACKESWPKLIKLQKDYGEKIQIILVNTEDSNVQVKKQVQRQENLHDYKMTLAMTNGDKKLRTLFPFQTVPKIIIIDKNGILKLVTDEIDDRTIRNLLDHKDVKVQQSPVNNPKLKFSLPLFVNGNSAGEETGSKLMWSSMIYPYSSNLLAVATFGNSKERSYGYMGNHSIKEMFQTLYGQERDTYGNSVPLPNSQVLFKNVDTTKLVTVVQGNYQNENRYTIQVTSVNNIPLSLLKARMTKELEIFFNLKTQLIKQVKQCLVISKSKYPITEYVKGNSTYNKTALGVGQKVEINKIDMKQLVNDLNLYCRPLHLPYPVLDESGFEGILGNIVFEVPDKVIDYKILGENLLKHGLQFSIKEREIEVLCISSYE